ncbi:MAG: hypothetical protein VKO39_04355 [Cyanobacteriota bacterium]|nr:hypothetical protein [Cyanobacteriota bacterium]
MGTVFALKLLSFSFNNRIHYTASDPIKMLTVYNDTIIYVLCPARIVTGGIEAVHQLVHKLRQFGHAAAILPTPRVSNPVLLQYRIYDVAFADHIIDTKRNILITTEVNPRALDSYHSIQKALWWLSVDNHEALQDKFDFESSRAKDIVHFVQSAYAADFLQAQGLKTFYFLTDYLHPTYFRQAKVQHKNNVVLYTPVKGAQHHIQQLMQADASLQWLPLTGMIRKLHAKTMAQGKVYVDFGRHPGKDRQPREAVVNGCCVIVGLAGAARFKDDLPIPDRYKFDLQTRQDRNILDTIHRCLGDYNNTIHDFAAYADCVHQDERRFEEEIKSIFGVEPHKSKSQSRIILGNIFMFIQQNNLLTTLRGLMNELLPLSITGAAKGLYRRLSAKIVKARH